MLGVFVKYSSIFLTKQHSITAYVKVFAEEKFDDSAFFCTMPSFAVTTSSY